MARRVASPQLVGRIGEVASLEAALAAAEQDSPSITLLAGEAGVGKSRLVREVEARARERGALALRGECIELSGGEFPYAPVVGALRGASEEVLSQAVDELPAEGRAELARLVPGIGRLADEPPAAERRASPQGRLFELLLALLRQLGQQAPLMFVIEDAHWADSSTRDFLSFLSQNLSRERLAVVATYRPDYLGPEHPLRGVVAELIRRDPVRTLELERLDRDEVEQLLEHICGELPALAVVEEVFARSGGNPFFAEELIATPDRGPAELPGNLRDALLVRVQALPEESIELLKGLAVLGHPAGDELLGELARLDEALLAVSLRAALSAHIVAQRPEDDSFDFRHALVREAVLSDLLPAERAGLSRAVAETLTRMEAGTAAELAYHWHAAGRLDAALATSIDAGLEAERVYASHEARRHFERAASLWDEVQPEPGSLRLDRVDLLRHAAEAARRTGDWDAAAALCREALALIDPEAEPLRAALLEERLGEYLLWDDEAALACYSTALSLLPADRRCERARVLGAKALALHFLQRWEESRDCAQEALVQAQEAGGRSEEGYARNILGVALAFLGDPEQGEEHVREAKRIAEELAAPEDVARAYIHLAEVLRIRGRVDQALEVMLEGEKLAARMGMTDSFGRAMSLNAAEDLLRLGRWQEAAQRLRWTARLTLRQGSELLQHSLVGRLAAVRGDSEAAAAHLADARARCDDQTPVEYLADVYAGLAELALWSGRPEDARREIADALERVGDRVDPLYTPVLFWLGMRAEADRATAARARGRHDEVDAAEEAARRLLAGLDALVSRYSAKRAPPEAAAYVSLCHAELTRVAGSPDAAAWQAAAEEWDPLGAYQAAYARTWHAEAELVGGGNRRPAADALGAARESALRMGAEPLLREIDALARAARLHLSAEGDGGGDQQQPAAASPFGLTSREVEVLSLIAEGCSNRQIAERLFISQKTASVHVSHILRKLDADNRVRAAGIAHQLGLLDTPPPTT